MSESKRAQSIASARRGFRIAASPFNAVKLDVIIIGCVAIMGAAGLEQARVPNSLQLPLLGMYGLAGGLWLAFRVRRVLRELRIESASPARAAAPSAIDVDTHGQN